MNLLPAMTGNLLGRFRIRYGTSADIETCDQIARIREKLAPSSLGWVRKDSYSARNHAFHVATIDDRVVGFVLYGAPTRGKNVGWHVVHALATAPGFDGYGIGRNLLYSVPCPIRLKCPQTVGKGQVNVANRFYAGAGMRLAGTEAGNKRALNVWEMRVLCILVQGNNYRMPEVARRSSWAYGSREIEKPRAWAFQVDIDLGKAEGNWRAYEWGGYLRKIRQWKPVAALVVDYFEPDQKPTMLRQIQDLKDAGVMRVLVCPKFEGAVADIPQDCIVAVSVPSTYAGYIPPLRELKGRDIHLLGGSPVWWLGQKGKGRTHSATGIIQAFAGAGARVVSVDGNSHTGAAEGGMWWADGRWQGDRNPFTLYDLAILSGRNIIHEVDTAVKGEGQLSLFAA